MVKHILVTVYTFRVVFYLCVVIIHIYCRVETLLHVYKILVGQLHRLYFLVTLLYNGQWLLTEILKLDFMTLRVLQKKRFCSFWYVEAPSFFFPKWGHMSLNYLQHEICKIQTATIFYENASSVNFFSIELDIYFSFRKCRA